VRVSLLFWPSCRRADLVLSGAYARPHERVWAQIALDVGSDDLSSDAIALHKPLICARHDDTELCRKWRNERCRKAKLCKLDG
jgi:hypothetical protein